MISKQRILSRTYSISASGYVIVWIFKTLLCASLPIDLIINSQTTRILIPLLNGHEHSGNVFASVWAAPHTDTRSCCWKFRGGFFCVRIKVESAQSNLTWLLTIYYCEIGLYLFPPPASAGGFFCGWIYRFVPCVRYEVLGFVFGADSGFHGFRSEIWHGNLPRVVSTWGVTYLLLG